jgi:hypothetical protein
MFKVPGDNNLELSSEELLMIAKLRNLETPPAEPQPNISTYIDPQPSTSSCINYSEVMDVIKTQESTALQPTLPDIPAPPPPATPEKMDTSTQKITPSTQPQLSPTASTHSSDSPPPHIYHSGDIYYCVNPLQFTKVYANVGDNLKVTKDGLTKCDTISTQDTGTNPSNLTKSDAATSPSKVETRDASTSVCLPPRGSFVGSFQFKFNLDESYSALLK